MYIILFNLVESIVPLGYFGLQVFCIVIVLKGGLDIQLFGINSITFVFM